MKKPIKPKALRNNSKVYVSGMIPEDLKSLFDDHSRDTGVRKEKILELALRSYLTPVSKVG